MNRLRRLLAGDRALVSAWVGTPGRGWIEAIARQRFDAVTLDMQHGLHGEENALAAIASIAATGKPALARIPVGRFDLASRLLDAGAHGVIAPMINSLDDAKALVAATKYPPVGERSFGASFAVAALGQTAATYVPEANRQTMAIAMIETREAFEALDDILALEGIDAVFMGPSDFSISIQGGGLPDPFGASTIGMIEDLASRARAKGKIAAVFAYDPQSANRAYALGYRLVTLGLDGAYLAKGIEPMMAALDFEHGREG